MYLMRKFIKLYTWDLYTLFYVQYALILIKIKEKWNSIKPCISALFALLLKTFEWFCNYMEMKMKLLTTSYKATIKASSLPLLFRFPHPSFNPCFCLMNCIFFKSRFWITILSTHPEQFSYTFCSSFYSSLKIVLSNELVN